MVLRTEVLTNDMLVVARINNKDINYSACAAISSYYIPYITLDNEAAA